MSKAAIGLVGCGIWGANILRDLLALGHDVFVVDTDPSRRELAKHQGAVGVLSDSSELPQVDGIIVATPAVTHANVVESVLHRNVPVFVEKPFTTDVDSAGRIAKLAPDRVFVMHIWMYHPGIEQLAQIARTEALGVVKALYTTRTNWTSPRHDVDIIWTAMPHDLSIALAVLGELPSPTMAIAEYSRNVPVGMVAVLGGPPYCVFNISTRYQDKRREVRLHCTDGVAVLPSGESSFIEIARGRKLEPKLERIVISSETALQRELRACMAYLLGGPAPRSSAAEGLRVVEEVSRLRTMAGLDATP